MPFGFTRSVLGVAAAPGQIFTFTSPDEGPFAPSQASVLAQPGYSGGFFNPPSAVLLGIQYWTVPTTGTYRITATGSPGRTYSNSSFRAGPGAVVRGDFSLTQNQVLAVLVGQRPPYQPYTGNWAGGGGGTFVARLSNAGSLTTTGGNALPLLVAGGGSASRNATLTASIVTARTGQFSTAGGNGNGSNGATAGQSPGVGGGWTNSRSGGAAGWAGTGSLHADTRNYYVPTGYPGPATSASRPGAGAFIQAFSGTNGAIGQGGLFNITYATAYRQSGGFGGGAPSAWGGMGGGGGYSGGGNGNNSTTEYGGGGGSYIDVSASNATTSTGAWSYGSAYSGHTPHATFSGREQLSYDSILTNGKVVLELLP